MENRYKTELELPCYMFDRASRLRPAAFMDVAQDLATRGARQIGCADAVLLRHHMVWILARMYVRFTCLPHFGDRVSLETWHRGEEGLFYNREYRMLFPDGTPAVTATSAWILMDVRSRKLVRPENAVPLQGVPAQDAGQAAGRSAPKIVAPKTPDFSPAGTHTVRYSDVDYNRHANNAKYVVWAMDVLPFGLAAETPLRELSINFNREALPGEEVALFVASAGDTYFVEGRIGGLQVFICKLVF
ncbi:MAG: hypothetical protein J5871_01750 [Bacteroidales bacterium]|nr:hypothetical protein [Bacteroidales bacterium]